MFKKVLLLLSISLLLTGVVSADSAQLKVVVPRFKSQGSAADAFKNLEKVSKENDPQKLGIRVIFKPKKAKKVNLSFDNMPVAEILRYICLSTGYKYKVTNRTVNITTP
jgi:hypothetical protein